MSNPAAAKRNQVGAGSRGSKLGKAEIQRRLEAIELATVSSVRALQMDLDGHEGVSSSLVLKRARATLR
jgi:hypothetical protein